VGRAGAGESALTTRADFLRRIRIEMAKTPALVPAAPSLRPAQPRQVADTHVPVVTFFLLLLVYAIVTFERINLCVTTGQVGQGICQ